MTDMNVIGKPVNRIDGRDKVTGTAIYTADHGADHGLTGVLHAAIVHAQIAKGRIRSIDVARAETAPGVVRIFHHGRAPALRVPEANWNLFSGSKVAENFAPLQGRDVHYHGQIIAIVLAETIEQARFGARLVAVDYEREAHVHDPVDSAGVPLPTSVQPHGFYGEEAQSVRGDPAAAYAAAAHTHEAVYTTPIEHHNAMELHATTASWNGGELTLYEGSQWVNGVQSAVAQALDISPDSIRVVSRYIGGAFGGKGLPKMHASLVAAIAREVRRPVKLMMSREGCYIASGLRPKTIQTLRVAANDDGTLVSIQHDTINPTSEVDTFVEVCGYPGRYLYGCENHGVSHTVTPVNIANPVPMRAPGEGPGTYALESALDELAHKMELDPVELRVRNVSDTDLHVGLPYSANNLTDCHRIGAEAFGWSRRNADPGRTRDEQGWHVGYGVASSAYPVFQAPAHVQVAFLDDGTLEVRCAAHDIGTGTYTVFAQIAAERSGLPMSKIRVLLGDTALPRSPAAVGALTVCSSAPAIESAIDKAASELAEIAVASEGSALSGSDAAAVRFVEGRLSDAESGVGEAFEDVLRRADRDRVSANSEFAPGAYWTTHSMKTFGAQFAEVRIDPDTHEIRVARMTGVFDFGRVLNEKTARSQLRGGMVFGIGMALLEHSAYDHETGRMLGPNLAEYLVPSNADVPEIDIVMLDRPDTVVNGIGAKGVGEIGNTGAAAAIANAVFNATGKRIRDLPITIDKLLA